MPSSKTSRIHGLDTLRSFAIILVLIYHYMVVVSGKNTFGFMTGIGWTGVDLFFVLSGYLIGNQIMAAIAQNREFSLKTFYVRRLLRTLPNYYVILALYFLFPTALSGDATAPLWQFLSFTQNLDMRPGETFTHSWSLCIEEQFYLILPATALLFAYTKKSVSWAWCALGVAMACGVAMRAWEWMEHGDNAITVHDYYQHIYYSSFTRFDELLPGVAIAMFKNFHPTSYDKILRRGDLLSAAGLLAVGVMFYLLSVYLQAADDSYNFWLATFGFSLLAVSFALLTLSALSPNSVLNRIKIPGAASLALWSYAIYLAHKPIYRLAMRLLKKWHISVDSMLGIGLIMLASLIGGYLLYRLVEMPFMRLRDRLYSPESGRAEHRLGLSTQHNIP
ncbi:peptidoglycan/LPS O-acetylase OafA/YrhL [Oxalobacteraceae bacterium GrIS 1.18]